MAFVDALLQYSAAQALSGAGSAVSTNIIDHTLDRDIGIGEPMCAVVTVDVAAGGTAPTLAIALQTDSVSGFGSVKSILTTQTFAAAALTAGARFVIPVPADGTFDRYSRLNYTLGGTAPTVTVTAYLTPQRMIQAEQVPPFAFVVQ